MTENEWYQALEQRHGKALQARLRESSAAICGLGGLGSNAALALARAGVGRLHLIDFDRVDVSNLNRQQYFASQIGTLKTDALSSIIAAAAPFCVLTTSSVRLTRENIALLQNDDIICECFDNPESKAELVNAAAEAFPQKYIVASSGMAGLHSGNTIRTKRVGRRLYICGDGERGVERDSTLFAARVMICAAHQANTVVRIIAGKFDE